MTSVRDKAVSVVKTLQDAGFVAVFAGGCVRDNLLGLEPNDYDIATSATPDQVEASFANTIPVGKSFGIVVVVIDGEEFEVATFRTDGEYSDARRPDSVEFSSIEEDAKRRDFTINAIFENPVTGEILDFVGGVADLKSNVLNTVGYAKDRFKEDALRILRAARFAGRFNLSLPVGVTVDMISLADTVTKVSGERIGDELSKILTGPNSDYALSILRDTGVLAKIVPEVC